MLFNFNLAIDYRPSKRIGNGSRAQYKYTDACMAPSVLRYFTHVKMSIVTIA